MPLIVAPFFALNSQYRPNIFVLGMASANPLVLAQASVIVNGSSVASISKGLYFDFGGTYFFEFDVSKLEQLNSAPKAQSKTSVFPDTLNQPFNQQNNDCHTYVGLIVTYYYNDPITGLLTQFGTIDTIPYGYYAHIGTRQTRDWQVMGMDLYIQQFAAGLPFLTNAPNPYDICPTENAFLSFIPATATTAQITTKDSTGAVIDSGMFNITPDATYVPSTIGVGVANLLTQTYFTGSVNMANPNIASYEVQIGQSFMFGAVWTFYPFSEIRKYNLVECCEDRSTRLHWLNRLGGADAYTFKNKKKIQEKTKSGTAQKPLTWNLAIPPTTSFDKGNFKIQQETQREYEVIGSFYTEDVGNWLAELLSSPEVYMETQYGLIAIVITDSSITTFENDELSNLTLTFIEANNLSLQQN